ncbi:hypothetical protein VP01_656g5 [Puccinia sorghi]|uniref:SWR1-complex protein 4 n=1 Tax=Puccinia sorghi TaxID=27349 RepID=A0A0L6UG68_9BASI|nr:hypothetical protein VP01_656g5 [Puccinia sorghi]
MATSLGTDHNSNRSNNQNQQSRAEAAKRPTHDDSPSNSVSLRSDQILTQLIGNNVPTIPLQVLKRNPRPNKNPPPTSPKWVWAPFQNPARKDGLQLKHWKRTDDQEVYRFAKYNTTSNVFSYSTEEYYHLLRDDDWTKAETDYLFNLINTYDLRFPVVHDRYEYEGSHERTLEDLKARYYSICQKLIPHRPNPSSSSTSHLDDPNKKHLIQSHHFDKQREIERKKHVKALLNRTPAQLQEEEFIYIETRRLEQNLLKRIKNRDELMKIIGGFHHHMLNEMKFWPIVEPSPTTLQLSRLAISNSINSNSASNAHPAEDGSRSSHPQHQPDKRNAARRDENSLDDGPVSASGGVGGEGQEMNLDPQAEMEEDKKHCIQRLDSRHPTGSSSGSTTHYRTVGLRSTRITLPKTAAVSSRLSAVMNELQIPNLLNFLPKPLIMPTRENVESYERLIQAANQLVDLRRLADRVDADLKAHRKKKDTLLAALTSSSADEALPAPTKTTAADDPVRPSPSNPGNESTADVPTHPEYDHPSDKTTCNKKRAASECTSSDESSQSTVGSPTHHHPQSANAKPVGSQSRKKMRKN